MTKKHLIKIYPFKELKYKPKRSFRAQEINLYKSCNLMIDKLKLESERLKKKIYSKYLDIFKHPFLITSQKDVVDRLNSMDFTLCSFKKKHMKDIFAKSIIDNTLEKYTKIKEKLTYGFSPKDLDFAISGWLAKKIDSYKIQTVNCFALNVERPLKNCLLCLEDFDVSSIGSYVGTCCGTINYCSKCYSDEDKIIYVKCQCNDSEGFFNISNIPYLFTDNLIDKYIF